MEGLFLQLITYGSFVLVCFALGTYCAARYLGLWGILLAHLLVTGVIIFLDVQWIQEEMTDPTSRADQDLVFFVGVMIRIVVMNVILMPIALSGYWRRVAVASRADATQTEVA